ncbi:hypothetical protein EUGRSUZ_D01287 [Eucalyptus grandis]|uniref:Uncharacterized protein n=2 Tax=Eucalyptus grandis TaxID=71139 RepID=A0ACC3L683_EUCGR|nr:hypothetical protein EUGRSUZ_D01287 [Eucalyptus grandis]
MWHQGTSGSARGDAGGTAKPVGGVAGVVGGGRRRGVSDEGWQMRQRRWVTGCWLLGSDSKAMLGLLVALGSPAARGLGGCGSVDSRLRSGVGRGGVTQVLEQRTDHGKVGVGARWLIQAQCSGCWTRAEGGQSRNRGGRC